MGSGRVVLLAAFVLIANVNDYPGFSRGPFSSLNNLFNQALIRRALIDLASPLACPRWRWIPRHRMHQSWGFSWQINL